MLIIKKGFQITMTREYSFLNAISKVNIKGTGLRDYNSVFMAWFGRSWLGESWADTYNIFNSAFTFKLS